MARAGASKSLDKPAPKTRGAQEAKVAAPAKAAAKPAKAVKASPAKAVNVKAKAAPAVKSVPTRKNSEVRQVAEAKGKRAVTATKAPAKAAPVATIDKVEGGFPAKTLDKLHRL